MNIKPKINQQITAPQIRVIGQDGENLGVLPREEALALVRPEEGIDLIEVVSTVNPPIAKLMSFDKYRYEQEKKEKKERQAQKAGGMKQVQISARAADHDLERQAKKAEGFMNEGHTVEISMRLRGREKGNQAWARQKLDEFLKMITIEYKLLSLPKAGGRGLLCQIAKK